MVRQKGLQTVLSLQDEIGGIESLMSKYADVPISLADACLVRMAELTGAPVITCDRDFQIYRKNRRQVIPLITPWDD